MIICIGREYGSGGHEIGKRIADNLHLSFYDNELLETATKHSSIEFEKLKKAEFSDYVNRKMQLLSLDEKSTITLVRKTDKQRKAYYDFYTGGSWGKPNNYDICINSSTLGLESTGNSLSIILPKLEKKYIHRGEMNKRSNNYA